MPASFNEYRFCLNTRVQTWYAVPGYKRVGSKNSKILKDRALPVRISPLQLKTCCVQWCKRHAQFCCNLRSKDASRWAAARTLIESTQIRLTW